MAKKKSETGVAKAGAFDLAQMGQEGIPALLEKVTEQIKAIRGDMPSENKTTGSLQGFGKIADIKDVATLIKAYSSVDNRQKAYDAAHSSMEAELKQSFKKPGFYLDGSSAEAWKQDILSRVIVVANKTKLDKLNKIKSKLEANLSAEDKMKKDMMEVASLLEEEE